MKTNALVISFFISFVSLSCANTPENVEGETKAQVFDESVIDSFNDHSYGFSLGYENGHYILSSDTVISGEEIKSLLNGNDWAVYYDGVVTLDGLTMQTLDGTAEVIYSFRDGNVQIVSIPNDPTQPNEEITEKVAFSDNLVTIGKDILIVCSLNEGRPIYLQALNNSTRWMYNHLEPK